PTGEYAMIGILFVWLHGEDRTRFPDSRDCTEPDLRHICDRVRATTVHSCCRRRSLRHPNVLFFRQRAAPRTRPKFPGAAALVPANVEDKEQSCRCGGV